MNTKEIFEYGQANLMETYKRFPVSFVRGEGNTLYDSDGKAYSDFLSGIAVCNLGYSNEAYQAALHAQVDKIIHTSNYFWIESQVELANLLTENSFAEKVFFCNSGAEANEGAVKLARRYQYDRGEKEKTEIVACNGAFHGRSLTTLSITDNAAYREGFGSMPAGFRFTPLNDIDALESAITDTTAAVIIEPVQGEGGVHPATPAFLAAVRKKCRETGTLLIFDEIQCGMGRTGSLFAYEEFGVQPDIVTMAKALGNGVPIGAILSTDIVSASFTPGRHGTTFGGNPLCTAAAVATVKEHLRMDLPARAKEIGAYFMQKLNELVDECEVAKEARGVGLLLGLELDRTAKPAVEAMLERGYVINTTADTVLRFLPPLVIEKEEIDAMIAELKEVLQQMA